MNSPVHELRVALTVDDYEAALRFYRDAFGLPLLDVWKNEGGKGALFDAGRATLEVLSTDSSKAERSSWAARSRPRGSTITFACARRTACS